ASAQRMLGVPYQYGGASPATGFDCSGLVQYAYEHAGIQVPRTTGGQYRASLLLPRNALQPGDVIFFRKRGIAKVSHVGIYLGKGRFIHAPSSGKRVTVADMNDPYWQRRYISGGRLF
ncbi:MAG: C40 family peptidase, partial [Proteobacteria bacterium]|nr:C40 family peptidase [Pseudomonadota bacterium]